MDNKFKAGTYNTVEDKIRIFKAWCRFLKSELNPNLFTKDLYSNLSLHWGFIAHYDRGGFYNARFGNHEGLKATVEQLEAQSKWVFVDDNCSGNADLHEAMHKEFLKYALKLKAKAWLTEKSVLEARIRYATQRLNEIRGIK